MRLTFCADGRCGGTHKLWGFEGLDQCFNVCEESLRELFNLPETELKRLWLVLDSKPSPNSYRLVSRKSVTLDGKVYEPVGSARYAIRQILPQFPKHKFLSLYYET